MRRLIRSHGAVALLLWILLLLLLLIILLHHLLPLPLLLLHLLLHILLPTHVRGAGLIILLLVKPSLATLIEIVIFLPILRMMLSISAGLLAHHVHASSHAATHHHWTDHLHKPHHELLEHALNLLLRHTVIQALTSSHTSSFHSESLLDFSIFFSYQENNFDVSIHTKLP